MPLIDDVSAAMTTAMRERDQGRLSALRMLKAALMNREVEKAGALDDTESRMVVRSLVKQRKESIEQFRAGKREDLAQAEEAELKILEAYLPAPLPADELRREAQAAIAAVGATSAKDLGKVMSHLMPVIAGRADGKAVNAMVRELLAGG